MYEIDKRLWHVCKICEIKIKDLAKKYGGCGIYFAEVFLQHLEKDHNITPEEYFEIYSDRPTCCKDCNKLCNIKKPKSAKMLWKKMCGNNEQLKIWSEQAKNTRKGSGNPMFGKTAWNAGLSTEDPRIEKMANARKGIQFSDSHKKSISEARLKFLATGQKGGMQGKKHSKETCEKLRQSTLNSIKLGVFKHLISKPHLKLKDILISLNIKFEEEKRMSYWSFDFYLTDFNIYIEVDGDYFHSNPNTRWPNGPKNETQKKVKANDTKKNNYCKKNKLTLIRFWENDIMNNTDLVIEEIKCLVQK